MKGARSLILTVNAGSSSVRLSLFDGDADAPVERGLVAVDTAPPAALATFLALERGASVAAVAHRVVHGGARLTSSRRIDSAAEAEIAALAELAPLHNQRALGWIRAARAHLPAGVAEVAVFDTAFFADLPEVARTYALPQDLVRQAGIRRFGFHGLAHQSMLDAWRRAGVERDGGGRIVTLQLGSGCSAAAIRDGKPIDTSMGFTPLEGLTMASRAGDVDPGLLLHLQRAHGLSAARLEEILSRESGLLGLSRRTGDMRVLLAAGDEAAKLAVEIYCYRAKKYIGAYLAALGGADGILFGGGVGENAPEIRARICHGLEPLGIAIDASANQGARGEWSAIGAKGSRIGVFVARVNEDFILAREARSVLAKAR